MITSIHAELELTECSGELRVNGIPIPGLPTRRPTYEISVPFQHALITGMNELVLHVDVAGKPSENRAPRRSKPSPEAMAVARLVAYEEGVLASPENGKVLATLTYKGADDDAEESPRVRRLGVDLGMSFGPWAWEKAPVLTLDDPTRREAAAVVREVHAALFSGDPEALMKHIVLRWKEIHRAYPSRDDGADRATLAGWMGTLAADPRRNVPLDPEHHDFRLIAGDRMIECVDDDHFPSVRIAQEVEPDRWAAAPYALSLARIDGRLRVLR